MAYSDRQKGRKAVAILLAGPIFLALTPMAIWQSQPDMALPLAGDWQVLLALAPLGVMATMLGGLIACIPVIVGSTVLEALGRVNVGCRLAAFWALIGAAMAGLPTVLAGWQIDWPTPALAFTGAICALICRGGVTWDDDAPLSDARSPAICTRHDT